MPKNALKDDYTPENIIQQMKMGKTREDLADMFGHKTYKSIDVFMNRKGYTWNRNQQCYEMKGKKPKSEEESTGPKKVRQALRLFEEGKEPKEVAEEMGFKNHLALAQYLKSKGYIWNHKNKRYEQENGQVTNEELDTMEIVPSKAPDQEEIIEFVEKNRERISNLLQLVSDKNLPRYSLAGIRISKTIHISNKLNELIKDFTDQKNISQREFCEIAAIEVLKKYGYEAEVKGILD